MKEEKNIPFKNYIVLSIILLLTIIVVIYFYMWYGEFKMNKMNDPIMDEYLTVINYNELENYLIENNNVIIYASSLNDEKTRKFEKKLKTVINDYSFNNDILYLDLTEIKKDEKLYNAFKEDYNLSNLPCILFFYQEQVYDVYDINENDYDIELLVSYLKIRGVIDD